MRSLETNIIEQLPDHLLCHILFFLPSLAEISRTSVISRRWRNLWHNTTCLDFDATTVMTDYRKISASRDWYISSINKIIDARVGMLQLPLVKELRICYKLEKTHQALIDRWIDFAITNRVETLYLDLGGCLGLVRKDQQCKLSEDMWYKAPSGLSNLKCLKSISLSCVEVSKQFIEFILKGCPLLEYLSLIFTGNCSGLDISGTPALRLRHLKLDIREDFQLTTLCAPYLTSFYCKWNKLDLQKIDVPMLTDLTIRGNPCSPPTPTMKYFERVWTYLPQLEKLHLIMIELQDFRFQNMPKLLKLKYLKLKVYGDTDSAFYPIVKFIEACPLLETFALEIIDADMIPDPLLLKQDGTKKKWWLKLVDKWRHRVEKMCCFKHLKVLKLYDGGDKIIDQEIVKCIINKAPSLEKLIVDTHSESTKYRVIFSSRQKLVKVLEAKTKELCQKSPRNIEVVIVG